MGEDNVTSFEIGTCANLSDDGSRQEYGMGVWLEGVFLGVYFYLGFTA